MYQPTITSNSGYQLPMLAGDHMLHGDTSSSLFLSIVGVGLMDMGAKEGHTGLNIGECSLTQKYKLGNIMVG
eukprot:13990713-Ditylum_brightwellii.AAC.1